MSDLNEKLISSEPAYLGKLVKLYLETFEQPDGRQFKREIIRHPGAVAMIPLTASGEVLLVRQYRGAAQQILLELPAGTLEPGEDPYHAAIRELQEEVGYKPGQLERLGGEFAAPGYTSEYIHLFLATDLTPSRLSQDEDERIDVEAVPLDEAVRRVMSGEIQDSKTMIGLLLIARRLGK